MDTVGKDFPDGFDIVIPCLLDGDGMMDALNCLTISGKIVAYGCIGTCKEFDFFKFHRKRATLIATEPRSDVQMRKFFQEGVQMVLDGLVNTGEMVTHIYPMEKIAEAFTLRNDKGVDNHAIHVLIDCEKDKEGQEPKGIVVLNNGGHSVQGSGSSASTTCC
jgi:threonine dehydrogenase-like Zn-dependent dehydrogenase